MTMVMEHFDEKGVVHFDEKGRENCDDGCHGAL